MLSTVKVLVRFLVFLLQTRVHSVLKQQKTKPAPQPPELENSERCLSNFVWINDNMWAAATPPLIQQQSTDDKIGLMLGQGRGRCAIVQISTWISFFQYSSIFQFNSLSPFDFQDSFRTRHWTVEKQVAGSQVRERCSQSWFYMLCFWLSHYFISRLFGLFKLNWSCSFFLLLLKRQI